MPLRGRNSKMKIEMKKVDRITAIVLLLFSAYVIAESAKMEEIGLMMGGALKKVA